jgi:hypothetical protein
VSQRLLDEAPYASLHEYVGLRVNVFRAMHTTGVFLDDEQSVLALREDEFALTVRIVFDVVLEYFYVAACQWYHSTLTRAPDDEVPESVRLNLLRRFAALLA